MSVEPFASAGEMYRAWASERGPWPALYGLIEAYERQQAEVERLRRRVADLESEVQAADFQLRVKVALARHKST